MSSSDTAGKATRTAPYVAWATLETLMRDLHEHGVPSRIDRSVLSKLSGSVRGQLQSTLKFLRLVSDDWQPTARLRVLADTYGTPQWKEAVEDVVKTEYAPIFALDLATATPSHFNETFRKAFPTTDAVMVKCHAFFINAAKAAGISLGPRLLLGKKPRLINGGRKKSSASPTSSAAPKPAHPKGRNEPPPPPPADGVVRPPNAFQLVAMLGGDMTPEEQQAVWMLIQYLKRKEAPAS